MKRKVLLAILFALAFMACSKKKDDLIQQPPAPTKVAPTLKENPAFPNMTMVGVKTDTIIASFYINPNDANAMTTTGPSSISFIYSGAFRPSTGYKNIYFTVTGPGIAPFTSEIKTNVIDAEDYFSQWSRSFASNTGYLVQIHSDITTSATDGAGADDKCNVVFKLVYQSDGSATNKTLIDTGQTITFSRISTSTLETAIAPTSPSVQNTLDGQEVPLMDELLTSTGGINTVNKKTYKFFDPSVSSVVTSVKMYEGSSLIGTATPVNGLAVFTNSFTVSTAKTITLKVSVGSVDETTSGKSFKLISDKTEYTDVGGAAKVNDVDRVGSDQYVFAALPTITKGNVNTGSPLVDSTVRDLFTHTISSVRTMGTKTFCYGIKLNDPNNNNVLLLKNIVLFEGTTDVTSQYSITKQNGATDSIFTEADTKLFFTKISGNGESIITGGIPKAFTIKAKVIGFNDSLKTDNISVELLGDAIPPPFDYKYVNTGGTVSPSRLFNTNSPSASAIMVHFMLTDHSATPHSSASGISSPDHFSGAGTGKPIFTGLTANYFYQ